MKYLDFEEIIAALKAVDDDTGADIEDAFNKDAPEAEKAVILGKRILDAIAEVMNPSEFECQDCNKSLDVFFAATAIEDGVALCDACNARQIQDERADERQRNRWQG